jgi:hypothetical protein
MCKSSSEALLAQLTRPEPSLPYSNALTTVKSLPLAYNNHTPVLRILIQSDLDLDSDAWIGILGYENWHTVLLTCLVLTNIVSMYILYTVLYTLIIFFIFVFLTVKLVPKFK